MNSIVTPDRGPTRGSWSFTIPISVRLCCCKHAKPSILGVNVLKHSLGSLPCPPPGRYPSSRPFAEEISTEQGINTLVDALGGIWWYLEGGFTE